MVPPACHGGVDRDPEREHAHEQAMEESSQGTPRSCGGGNRRSGAKTVAPRPGVPRPCAARLWGRADQRSRKRSPAPLPGRPTPAHVTGGNGAVANPRRSPLPPAPGGLKNEKGRGGFRHHGPRGSNRSPPASGVDRCENDADWVWGEPRTFLGIRINALGLAPPTERGDRVFEVRCHRGGLGRSPWWRPPD